MGPVEPRRAKPRDRVAAMASVERIRFTSAILPRRSTSRPVGLTNLPELATGAEAFRFWKALDEVSPTTRHQRCTMHKTANVPDKMPKSIQPAPKADLREVWAAPGRITAVTAVAIFAKKYGAKYEKAVS